VESVGKKWSYLKKPLEENQRRQDYPDNFFVINGAVYIVSFDFIFSRKTFVVENETMLYPMSRNNGLDIDELIDLIWAEFYMKYISSDSTKK
jgi:CMP-N,N'-diacetyllegionaminic acid synthase